MRCVWTRVFRKQVRRANNAFVLQTDWRTIKYTLDTEAASNVKIGLLPVTESSKECPPPELVRPP